MSLRPFTRCLLLGGGRQSCLASVKRFFGGGLPSLTWDSTVVASRSKGVGRLSFDGARATQPKLSSALTSQLLSSQPSRLYHVAAPSNLFASRLFGVSILPGCSQLENKVVSPSPAPTPLLNITRSVTKFSLRKGRRKTAKSVIKRFFRLDWGGWISAQPGRARHLWKKSIQEKNRLRHHYFHDHKEGNMLDKMVTKYWVKKKWFVDDPYESYQTRDNFLITKGVQGIDSIKTRRIKKYDYNKKKSS